MNLEQSNPLVTVYIPTFNRVELLKRAVESVRQQTYQNLEIIVVDDCSTDGTHEYLKDISNKDSRIRFFLKEKNSGACVSRNIAIKNANGEYITGLDDDDYFLLDRIQFFVNNIYLLNKYECLASRLIYITKKNNIKKSLIEKLKPNVIKRKDLLSYNYIGNQIFIKTEKFKGVNFNEDIPAWQDLFCWYEVLRNGNAYILSDFTYVMDMSHDFERISNQKIGKINRAYDIFVESFGIDNMLVLRNHLIAYGVKDNVIKYRFLALRNSFNLYSLFCFFISIKNEK